MGVMAYSLFWVMQEFYHQPYFVEGAQSARNCGCSARLRSVGKASSGGQCLEFIRVTTRVRV